MDTNKNTPILELSDKREVVISLKNVRKTFYMREKNVDSIRDRVFNVFSSSHKRRLEALKGINLEIKKGDFFGIIGRNGSGKSTLLKIITGAIPPDKGGEVNVTGKFIRLALGMGFNPNLSARDNIYVNASVIGLSFKQIGQKFSKIIEFAELEDFIDTKVKFYSSGMRSRLAFAIAVHAEADIFLMDEFFGGVGDESFKKKSAEVFQQAFLDGRTIIHVSHNLKTIKEHCNQVLLLNKGEVVTIGEPNEVIKIYRELFRKKKSDKKNIKVSKQ